MRFFFFFLNYYFFFTFDPISNTQPQKYTNTDTQLHSGATAIPLQPPTHLARSVQRVSLDIKPLHASCLVLAPVVAR